MDCSYNLPKQLLAACTILSLLIFVVMSELFEFSHFLLRQTNIRAATTTHTTSVLSSREPNISGILNFGESDILQLPDSTAIIVDGTSHNVIGDYRTVSSLPSSSSFSTSSLSQMPWLEAYVKWHAHSLEYKNSKTLTHDDPNQYLIWQCYPRGSCGGLGDRFNGIMQAFFMAICSNRVFLIDDGSFNHKKRVADGPNWLDGLLPHRIFWNRTDVISSTRSIINLKTTKDVTKLKLYTSPHLLERYKVVVLHNNLYLGDKYWSMSTCLWKDSNGNGLNSLNNTTYTLFRMAFNALFQWNPHVVEQAQLLLQKSGIIDPSTTPSSSLSLKNNYIGWHVRTGSGKSWKDPPRIKTLAGKTVDSNKVSGSEIWETPMLQCTQRMQRAYQRRCNHSYVNDGSGILYDISEVNNDESLPLVYLTTDKDEVKDFVAQDIVASATIRYIANLEIMHVDISRLKKLSDANKAMWNVWAELYILINADCLVTSRSGFSDLAILLGKQKDHLQLSRCSVQWNDCNEGKLAAATQNAFC